MAQLICTTSYYSLGSTFVDWTINFLSGKKEFFNTQHAKWFPVVDSPLTNINAHGHRRSTTVGAKNTIDTIKSCQDIDTDFISFYGNPARLDQFTNQTNDIEKSKEQVRNDYGNMLSICSDNNVPIIFIDLLPHDSLYIQTERSTDSKLLFNGNSVSDLSDLKENFINNFCKDSFAGWGTTAENAPAWVKREVIALNVRPYDIEPIRNYISPTTNLLYIESNDLWFNFQEVKNIIFKYLDIQINETRLPQWEKVYNNWRQIHSKNLVLSKYLDYICDAIINDRNFDLARFNLSLWDEAIILHTLLYKYNKNINAYNLTQFPNNTKILHKLLIDNIHTIEKLY